jgi:hypothetical protein
MYYKLQIMRRAGSENECIATMNSSSQTQRHLDFYYEGANAGPQRSSLKKRCSSPQLGLRALPLARQKQTRLKVTERRAFLAQGSSTVEATFAVAFVISYWRWEPSPKPPYDPNVMALESTLSPLSATVALARSSLALAYTLAAIYMHRGFVWIMRVHINHMRTPTRESQYHKHSFIAVTALRALRACTRIICPPICILMYTLIY